MNIKRFLVLLLAFSTIQLVAAETNTSPNKTDSLPLPSFHDHLVPKGFVLQEKDWHIWCNAPMRDATGKVHLFVARWPIQAGFDPGWHTRCEIAHYRAERPEGPYSYVDTVLQGDGKDGCWRRSSPHNVTVVHLPDGRYAMLFIANSGGKDKEGRGFPANQKIGMMLASSLDGPWTFAGQDGLILDVPTDPSVWSHDSRVGVNNPTLLPMPDGRFFLYYKAMQNGKVRQMGLAIANKVEGPYVFQKEPLTQNKGTIEDGFAFLHDGKVVLLVTDCHSKTGIGGGDFYVSDDGIRFSQQTIRAYESVDKYLPRWPQPRHCWSPWVLQRPALLFDEQGEPTHLFTPCGTAPEGTQSTATFLFEIKKQK